MKKLVLYPVRKVKGVDFTKEVRVTVPNQTMSLHEIIQRFIKKQSLPIGKEGLYNDQYGIDLEKVAREDIVEQMELASKYKERSVKMKEVLDQRVEADRKAASPPPPEPTPKLPPGEKKE